MDNLYTSSYETINTWRKVLGDVDFIKQSEQRFYNQIKSVASEAIDNNIRLIRLAGPSGSGKTTTAKRIVDIIKSKGIPAYYISMDNWYKTLKVELLPKNEDGEPDFESPELLDIEALKEDIHNLLNGEEIQLRQFDFVERVSSLSGKTLKCEENGIVALEGLHAIHPIFDIKDTNMKVYVEPFDVVLENGSIITSSDIRLYRRIHRDKVDRGMTLKDTMKKCRSVDRGQAKYIAPYTNDANILRIDTLISYELFIHKKELPTAVTSLLDTIDDSTITRDMIPDNSILKEFYK